MGCGSSKSTETTSTSQRQEHREPAPGEQKSQVKAEQRSQKPAEQNTVKPKEEKKPEPEPEPESRPSKPKEKDFVQEALEAHNEIRAWHGVPPLRVAEDLNAYSQKWADNIASRDTMEHSNCTMDSGERVGENIYYCWSSDPSAGVKAHDAVKSWYDEIKDYNYNNPKFAMGTGEMQELQHQVNSEANTGKNLQYIEKSGVYRGHFTQVVWKDSQELGIAKARSKKGSWFVVANYRPPGNFMGAFKENVLPTKRSNS